MKQWLKIERIPGPLASSYEKATRLAIDIYYKKVAAEIVLSFNKGVILDLGTGPGYLPIEILKKSSDIKIVGIDLSRRLIQLARKNAHNAGFDDRLDFQFGNSAKLRFDDASFDMVLSTGMLHSLKAPVRVFREIHRVLKSGGQAWIYDPAQVARYIDGKKWKASLTYQDRFFLWLFTALKLLRPMKTYNRAQVTEMIRVTDFEILSIEEHKDEIKIRLKKNMTLCGKIVSGVRQGAFFTQLDWFQEQCLEQLGFKPYAGTLNLEISTDDVPKIEALEKEAEIEFIPPDSTFCSGKAHPVMLEGIRAAIVFPAAEVRVHGKNVIEIISDLKLKDALKVDDGNFVTLTIAAHPS